MNIIVKFILLNLMLPPLMTCLIETPIIRKMLRIDSILYIVCVNLVTNIPFVLTELTISYFNGNAAMIFVGVMEVAVIPISEALLFYQLKKDMKKCLIGSYISNAVSFSAGMVLSILMRIIGL